MPPWRPRRDNYDGPAAPTCPGQGTTVPYLPLLGTVPRRPNEPASGSAGPGPLGGSEPPAITDLTVHLPGWSQRPINGMEYQHTTDDTTAAVTAYGPEAGTAASEAEAESARGNGSSRSRSRSAPRLRASPPRIPGSATFCRDPPAIVAIREERLRREAVERKEH